MDVIYVELMVIVLRVLQDNTQKAVVIYVLLVISSVKPVKTKVMNVSNVLTVLEMNKVIVNVNLDIIKWLKTQNVWLVVINVEYVKTKQLNVKLAPVIKEQTLLNVTVLLGIMMIRIQEVMEIVKNVNLIVNV